MLRDFGHAIRRLGHAKGWTAVVLVSLALGIGANTALFTAVNGVLLQSVALPDPDALVRLKWSGKNDMMRNSSDYGSSQTYQGQNVRSTVSYAVFLAMRAANQTLTDVAAGAPFGAFNVVIDGAADLASGFQASGNYFSVLRVPLLHGRGLEEADDQPGASPVAVISHAFWQKRFAGDPAVVGRTVTMNGLPVTIIGVTHPEFTGIQRLAATAPDVTVPIALETRLSPTSKQAQEPTSWYLQMMGRLKPGITLAQVQGNLEGVFQQTARAGRDAYMAGLSDEERGLSRNQVRGSEVPHLLATSGRHGVYDLDTNATKSARILGAVVALVLLIVCANVANLLLARAGSRRKEIAIRLSMGATRARLVRQLLTESVVLSGLGGLLGFGVGYWSRPLLPFGATAPLDWRVFTFVGGLSVLTGLVFGLVPALRATKMDLSGSMKEDSRGVIGGSSHLSRGLLVVQVALSLMLIVGAGLFLRTLQNLRSVDVGFNTSNLLMFSVSPQQSGYDADRTAIVFGQLRDALAALPGVQAAALTRVSLLSGNTSTSDVHVPDRATPLGIHMMNVSAEFFDTMQIPVRLGRAFTSRDDKAAPKVAIINEAAARELFPEGNPIGKRAGFSPEQNREFEIVGVVRDTKYSSIRDAAPPTFYQHYRQGVTRQLTFLLRTAGDPRALVEPARTAVRQVDGTLPITNISTQTEQVERRFAQERLFATAYALFGGLSLILAAIGLFGLQSYNVARRTNEIGIRMALGAQRGDVVRMVLRESLILVGIGVVLGVGAALAAGSLVSSTLYGLSPTDALTLTLAIALIVAVSTLAGYLPARRAARVDPMIALQHR